MEEKYTEKFEWMRGRLEELSEALAQPDIMADIPRWQRLSRERAQLEPAVQAWQDYQKLCADLADAWELADDPDMGEMAREEARALTEREKAEAERLKLFLIPQDPNDQRNVILEVRAGAGGDEASLFAALLLRMYMRYAERKGWQASVTSISDTELGGVKEAVVTITGRGAFTASTASSACRSQKPEDASIPAHPPWPCCPRPRLWRWISSRRTCASIPTAPAAMAVSTSTAPTAPCASRTCPPAR